MIKNHFGGILSFDINVNGNLKNPTEIENTKGIVPCHLEVLEDSKFVVNYLSGNIVKIGEKTVTHSGKGAHSLSLQLAKYGITVNNVAPGVICTDRNVEVLSDLEYAKKVTDSIPVGFYGEPGDCAGIVSLLCSDEGRYITGQNIFVDGGKSVQ